MMGLAATTEAGALPRPPPGAAGGGDGAAQGNTPQVARPLPDYVAAYPKWNHDPSKNYFRHAWRDMCDAATVTTHHSTLITP
ncbi:hypothetical protein, partial [Nocardia cyriacigeorgica]|uniref:hypothetical protein n=1 Tax=Nocardia cyriacigeorgica TaxID=135487 RepID=UPI002458F5EC